MNPGWQEKENMAREYHPVRTQYVRCLADSMPAGAAFSGAYFCEHAFYAVAYGEGWIEEGMEGTMGGLTGPAEPTEILWSRVALGRCKDFGHRCVSDRDHEASLAKGLTPKDEDKKFEREWPEERTGERVGNKFLGHRRRPPQVNPRDKSSDRYNSVAGTEGDLMWTAHPDDRFRRFVAKFGKQFVVFATDQ